MILALFTGLIVKSVYKSVHIYCHSRWGDEGSLEGDVRCKHTYGGAADERNN